MDALDAVRGMFGLGGPKTTASRPVSLRFRPEGIKNEDESNRIKRIQKGYEAYIILYRILCRY